MTKFTKADIDGLVEALPTSNMWTENPGDTLRFDSCTDKVQRSVLRTALYLAAGLTAEGKPKPEKVQCWLYRMKGQSDPHGISLGPIPAPGLDGAWEHIPGTFVPDGAA